MIVRPSTVMTPCHLGIYEILSCDCKECHRPQPTPPCSCVACHMCASAKNVIIPNPPHHANLCHPCVWCDLFLNSIFWCTWSFYRQQQQFLVYLPLRAASPWHRSARRALRDAEMQQILRGPEDLLDCCAHEGRAGGAQTLRRGH